MEDTMLVGGQIEQVESREPEAYVLDALALALVGGGVGDVQF